MNPKDWTPDLVIAVIVILLCFVMKFCGIDGEVWAVMLLACGWVFGKQYEVRRDKRKVLEHHGQDR